MRTRVAALALALVVGAGTHAAVHDQAAIAPADVVLVNGAVLTVDARDTVAEAVAIAGGRIAAVGTTAEIQTLAGPATEVVNLGGRAVTPGLIDAHVHFTQVDKIYSVDLSDPAIRTMADVLQRVGERVKGLKPGEWLRGRGWDEGRLAEQRYITAADLDTVAPNNPVWLTQTTSHYGVANTFALKLAEVHKGTPDPPAGTIDRAADGTPTGVMKESAQQLITRLVPPFTREQQKRGLQEMIADFAREGMTAAKDPSIGEAKWELYEELLKEGRLDVRVFALWAGPRRAADTAAVLARVQARPSPSQALGNGLLTSGGVKLFMDGSGGARTAWQYDDWSKDFTGTDMGNKGYPSTPPDDYRQIVRTLHGAGVHVSTHAIGDRAIDWVVDTYDQVLQATPTKDLRHGIIHGNTPTDHAIDVMARLQRDYQAGYPEAQAPFLWWLGDNYAANLGPARARRLKPFRTYVRKGVQWAGGSDYGVTPYPARYGLWSSVVRETLNGTHGRTPFGLDEAIDVHTALRSYTQWAAHALFLEDRIGTIEVGKDADLAVWDRNPYAVPASALRDLVCERTFVQGRTVYRKDR